MRYLVFLVIVMTLFMGCSLKQHDKTPEVKGPITIMSPEQTQTLPVLSINKVQKQYISSGSVFAFNCMKTMYAAAEGKDMLFSPLSLQYALAMAANGASGDTLKEIVDALGYDDNLQNVNAYMKILLEQLPALDDNVEIKVTDALLVNEDVKVLKDFQDIMN